LLSSSICFNIENTFDEKTLNDLNVIKDVEKHIKIRMPTIASSLIRERTGATPGGEVRGTVGEDTAEYSQHLLP